MDRHLQPTPHRTFRKIAFVVVACIAFSLMSVCPAAAGTVGEAVNAACNSNFSYPGARGLCASVVILALAKSPVGDLGSYLGAVRARCVSERLNFPLATDRAAMERVCNSLF